MRFLQTTFFICLFAVSQFSFSAACDASGTSTSEGNGNCTVTDATTGTIIQLNFNAGFDSSTSVSVIDGNNSTTLGGQRKSSFIKAAEIIAAKVDTAVTLIVDASFSSALDCEATWATLGSAGATANLSVSSPAPSGIIADTNYPIGLYNAITGSDVSGAHTDVTAEFNADIGDSDCLSSSGWYYGFSTPGANEIGFTTVLLHEVTHGLGFASLVNPSNGTKSGGLDDIFSNFLYDNVTGDNWNDAGQTDEEREDSIISIDNLLWSGTNVNTQAIGLLTDGFNDGDSDGEFESGDQVEMYAPCTTVANNGMLQDAGNPCGYESGSSISHFSTDATPNELMEPSYTESQYTLSLALYLLKDIGWTIANIAPSWTTIPTQNHTVGDTASINLNSYATDSDGDSMSYTGCESTSICSISSNTLTINTASVASESIVIQADDSNGGTTNSASFTITISASTNTAPTLTITDQSTLEDNALVVDLSGFASDANNDILSYSVSACPTNITCTLAGANLTLIPDTNHNGTTHTVTIEVTDGNGGTNSDSFNLAISAVNDAPVWQALGSLSLQINESQNLQLANLVNDAESDALSFSSACHANLTCSFSGSTLTLTAVDGIGETVSIAIQADDGNSGTNTANLSITITSNLPSTHVEVDDNLFNHGDSLILNLDDGQVDVLGGSGNYAYELEFDGQDASHLITSNNSGLQIALPDSGAFAGSYTLTITDNSNGEVVTLTIERPLRLNFSSEGLLNSDSSQTLNIEGGEAGSQYLVEELVAGHLIFSDASGQPQSTFVAANSAQTFNGATIHLASNTVSDVTELDVRVTSLDASYSDVSRQMNLYPAIKHSFTVTDTSGNAITQAMGTLVENARLVEVNIALIHNADANGQFSIWLPDNDQFYGLNVAANGYHSSDLTLSASLIEHLVTLTAMSNSITLSGSINALGTQDFTRNNPTMSLHFSDGRSEAIIVTVSNAAQASFSHEVDLNTHILSTMRIEQVDSLDIEIDMSPITQSQSYNILLERTVAIVVSAPAPKESSGVGTIDLRYCLLLLLLGLVRKSLVKGRRFA